MSETRLVDFGLLSLECYAKQRSYSVTLAVGVVEAEAR